VYGARAVLKQVAEGFPQREVSVHVVWMPMVPGDDEPAARTTGRMFAGLDVRQYYDGGRVVGSAFRRDVFPNCASDALSVMPEEHPLYAQLREWATPPRAEGPLWDAVLFYPPGVEWGDQTPVPRFWSKQVAYLGENAGGVTGVFFRNDCKAAPVDSDWHREVREAMANLLER